MCNHQFCNRYHYIKGVGAIFTNDYSYRGITVKNAILLGKEKGGQYKNMYNLFGGRVEPTDGCLIYAIMRELCEEAKLDKIGINIKDINIFNLIFSFQSRIRHFVIKKSLIFVGVITTGLTRSLINRELTLANLNQLRQL